MWASKVDGDDRCFQHASDVRNEEMTGRRRTLKQVMQQAASRVYPDMQRTDANGNVTTAWVQIHDAIDTLRTLGPDERGVLERMVDWVWKWLVVLVR